MESHAEQGHCVDDAQRLEADLVCLLCKSYRSRTRSMVNQAACVHAVCFKSFQSPAVVRARLALSRQRCNEAQVSKPMSIPPASAAKGRIFWRQLPARNAFSGIPV